MGYRSILLFCLVSVGCSGLQSQKPLSLSQLDRSDSFVQMSLSTVAGFTDNSFSLDNFTLNFNAVPSQNQADVVIGLSQGQAASYSDLAVAIRFNPLGQIDARNGSSYSALNAVSYSAGVSYNFRINVNVPAHTYTVSVTPQGKAAVVVAQNYAFRSEQSTILSLGNLAMRGDPGRADVTGISLAVTLPDITAPAGQKPTLLAGFKVRPSFPVAGVDYAVGIPAGKTLKNPATISMAGVSVNSSWRLVTVTGNDVTLDGYDFGLNGGWSVESQAANTRIVNSKFLVGAIVGAKTASNLYVGYCIIDGANGQGTVWGGLISNRGRGLTVEYSWIKNAGGDLIQQVDGGDSIVIRYNLLEQAGMQAGAHGDYTQLAGGPFTLTMVGNTAVQSGGTTQGLMTEFVSSGEIGNNVMIGSMSYATAVDLSSLVGTVSVHDNYFGNLGYGFVYPNSGPGDSSPKSLFKNNVNMVTGAVLQD